MSNEALTDARQLRYFAASLTYNDTVAEGEAKHRLHEIAMRLETGYYTGRAFKAGEHVGAGMERAGRALASLPEGAPNPDSVDAKRYRWLKTNKLGYNGMAWHWMPGEPLWNDNLDAAIDEATKP